MSRSLSSLIPAATLITLLLASSACVVHAQRDVPKLDDVDAYCTFDGWWELITDVEHPRGSYAIDYVWVDVTEVWTDVFGDVVYADVGSIDLEWYEDETWFVATPSDPTFLDCGWPWEYDLTFNAEDDDGDLTYVTITR